MLRHHDPSPRRRSWWGWGWADEFAPATERAGLAAAMGRRFGTAVGAPADPVPLEALRLPAPRLAAPPALEGIVTTSTEERARHSWGRSYADVVRGFRGDFASPPDLVAYPGDESDVVAVLDFCTSTGVACVPYGGGSSVVGGVSTAGLDDRPGVVSLDLTRLDRVLDVDRQSRAARIQAGVLGPSLEDQLRHHGFTLRHFPQSFEFSTLGGWLATRSGGHFATLFTHIDDFVESIRLVTPSGVSESRRLPGSGAGPSPDGLVLGSEGTLGVITEAWMRLQDRPTHRARASVHFPSFTQGALAVRSVAQSGLWPANCRLLDPDEAALAAGVEDGSAVLVLGFESAHQPVEAAAHHALDLCRLAGGWSDEGVEASSGAEGARRGAAGTWRSSFLRAPYTRDALVSVGIISETFETACTWDRFDDLHHDVTAAVTDAVRRVCGDGLVTCRFTHAYPDGPAPYFTVLAPGRPGSELSQWAEVKAAASEAVLAAGGTITHHHAVGRDHRPWYDRQRPDVWAAAFGAAKRAVDPAGVMNPGVLVDP